MLRIFVIFLIFSKKELKIWVCLFFIYEFKIFIHDHFYFICFLKFKLLEPSLCENLQCQRLSTLSEKHPLSIILKLTEFSHFQEL